MFCLNKRRLCSVEGEFGAEEGKSAIFIEKKCVDLLLADVKASSQYGNKDQYALRQDMIMTMLNACINLPLQLAA